MKTTKTMCLLADLSRSQDEETGNSIYSAVNVVAVVCDKEIAGVQTQQLAQAQNMVYSWSVELDRMHYNKQKYVYIDGETFEVKGITKGSKPALCRLNVVAISDRNVLQAIKGWMNANL